MITKDKIKQSFLQLLEQMPLEKISISIIVNHAQINRSTYYYYFYSQDALFEEIKEDIIDKLIKKINENYKNKTIISVGDRINEPTIQLFNYLELNKSVFKPFTLLNDHYNTLHSLFQTMILRFFEKSITLLPKEDIHFDYPLYLEYHSNAIANYFVKFIVADGHYTPEQMTKNLLLFLPNKIDAKFSGF